MLSLDCIRKRGDNQSSGIGVQLLHADGRTGARVGAQSYPSFSFFHPAAATATIKVADTPFFFCHRVQAAKTPTQGLWVYKEIVCLWLIQLVAPLEIVFFFPSTKHFLIAVW